jgi:hypothetical protein
MKKSPVSFCLLLVAFFSIGLVLSCHQQDKNFETEEENDMYDGPDKAAEFEFNRTKDPSTGTVPRERYMEALKQTMASKADAPFIISAYGTWVERGPNTDATGPSNGNTRANSGITSGRMRAILVDAGDASGKTVWVGGVDGGLWKTTDITASPATWTLVNDYLSNLAISAICQSPSDANTMYFCTGEGYFNADAVQGNGVFKSTDHGVTWTQLSSTSTYFLCNKIVCDASGNVYLGTNGNGMLRSINGGTSWTNITPTGSSSRIADVEISSTGRLHITTGLGNSAIGVYRFTDIPVTVAAATWTTATTPFTYPSGANCRVELACNGNVLYALPSNNSANVTAVWKSTDGGAIWTSNTLTAPNQTDLNGGQAWYCLGVDIDPSNTNNVIIGSLNCLKSTDGGATWAKISEWVGLSGQYVHADQHIVKWYDNGNKLLIGCDGGIHYSADKGVTIRDRNAGLRIKQFYSCAIHPSSTNYFLAGAQDNGTHQLSNAGLGASIEVTGGDGAFTAIDQDESNYQFGAYVYQTYRRSINSGSNWSSVNFYTGTNVAPVNFGQFINPFVYDNSANIIYASANAGNFFRWTTPQTTAGGNYFESGAPSFPASASQVGITAIGAGSVMALSVSPYTANRLYLGTSAGKIVQVDNANTIASGSAGADISTGLPGGSVSCIQQGTTDQNLICSFSNYGLASVWVSSNGGTSWTSLDNNGVNLADMPVRWCMFVPGDNTRALIATETGVWLTQLINGTSTVWIASPTFPIVRTDMLQYRSSDKLIAAATHGRGLWTQGLFSVLPANDFTLRGRWQSNTAVELNWDYDASSVGSVFEIEESADGTHFTKAGSLNQNNNKAYQFIYQTTQQKAFYRIKNINANGAVKYSNTIKLFKSSTGSDLSIVSIYPNPVQNELKVAFNISGKGNTVYSITSVSGQTIWKKQEQLLFTGNYIKNWDISGIPKGNYILSIFSGNEKVSMKFSKQ